MRPGRLVNGTFALSDPLEATANAGTFARRHRRPAASLLTYTGPISNDAVALGFRQHIGAASRCAPARYSKTLTFTLSTTTP